MATDNKRRKANSGLHRKKFYSRIKRLTEEFFFALTSFKNPFVYYGERLGVSPNKKITLKLRGGPSYLLDANANQVRALDEIWHLQIYDRLLKNIKQDSVVIDIGANVGIFSVKAATAIKNARVFSYEPQPRNFELLKENISLNKLEKVIFPFNMAVSDMAGSIDLFFEERDSGGGSLYNYDSGFNRKKTVSCTTLADIFETNRIEKCDFLKMDCEGAEGRILLNAPKELFSKIKNITLEWHASFNEMSIEEFKKFLSGFGFSTSFNDVTFILYAWKQ